MMSALPLKADKARICWHVRLVPKRTFPTGSRDGLAAVARRLMNRHHRLRQFLVQSALFLSAEPRRLENCDKSRKRSGKAKRHFVSIFLQHRGSGVLSDVEGFIERKANPYRLRNTTLRDLLFVHQQRRGGCFADAAAIVFEPNADDVIAGRERLIGSNAELVLRLVGIRVGKERFAILNQQGPADVSASYSSHQHIPPHL